MFTVGRWIITIALLAGVYQETGGATTVAVGLLYLWSDEWKL